MSNQPIRRTQARLAERERMRAQHQRNTRMKQLIPFALGGIVLLFVVFVALTTVSQATPGVIGARIQIDRDEIDLGNQPFDRTVRAMFTVKNAGDGTLKLEVPRLVTALEGC